MTKSCKLALVQMLVEGGAKARNLTRAEARIGEAAAIGASIVLLPEALDLGWTHPSARTEAKPIPEGEPCRRLRAAAQRHGVFVCAGRTERSGDRLFNASVLIDPQGEILLHHRKIHELDFALELYSRGDQMGVAETPFGRIGVMICADGFAPGQVISRTLTLMGAELILSPCAWAVPANHDNARDPYGQLWLDNYGAVSRDCDVVIAGCSNVGLVSAGEWAGRQCIGCSLIMGSSGQPLARASYGVAAEEILLVDLPTSRQSNCLRS